MSVYKLAMDEFVEKNGGIFLAIWAAEFCRSLPRSAMGFEIVQVLGGKKMSVVKVKSSVVKPGL